MSQGAKPGYGPKDPTPIRGAANTKPDEKKNVHGFAGSPDLVRSATSQALAASKAANSEGASHTDRENLNVAMSNLQQHDSLAHSSVLAIHHLEGLIAKGQETKQTRGQLKQAHANLRARLANGNQR